MIAFLFRRIYTTVISKLIMFVSNSNPFLCCAAYLLNVKGEVVEAVVFCSNRTKKTKLSSHCVIAKQTVQLSRDKNNLFNVANYHNLFNVVNYH